VHGAFVSDQEVHSVVRDLKKVGKPNFIEEVIIETIAPNSVGGDADSAEDDPLYGQAVSVVVESRRASISYVQRRLKIGYNRAARMIETMEANGVVAKAEGSNSLEVIAPPPPE